MVGYFTVNENLKDDLIDWNWLLNRQAFEKKEYTKLFRFGKPIENKNQWASKHRCYLEAGGLKWQKINRMKTSFMIRVRIAGKN